MKEHFTTFKEYKRKVKLH